MSPCRQQAKEVVRDSFDRGTGADGGNWDDACEEEKDMGMGWDADSSGGVEAEVDGVDWRWCGGGGGGGGGVTPRSQVVVGSEEKGRGGQIPDRGVPDRGVEEDLLLRIHHQSLDREGACMTSM